MRAFSLVLLFAILGTALYQCNPIDEEFGGFEPGTLERLLASDSAKGWQLLSKTINGTLQEGGEPCEEDDLWVFAYGDSTFFRWSSDSLWCTSLTDTVVVQDSVETDSGFVLLEPDTVAVQSEAPLVYHWEINALGGITQITTDTIYVRTDSTESLRRLFDQSTEFFSWYYFELDENGDSLRIEESYEFVPLPRWPLNEE